MALPLDEVRTQIPVYQQPTTPPPVSNPDPVEAAKRILDVGSQWGTDDYDKRLDAFADELGKGDALYREQLTAEIFKQDPNALGSWLQPDRANKLQNEGRISHDQKGVLAESLAAAYNNGDIPQFEIGVGPIPKDGNMGKVQMSQLENRLLSGFFTNGGLGAGPDTLQNAQNLREFIDFFNVSSGPEVAAFRETFGKHLIDQYVLNPAVGYNNPSQRDAAALLATNILGFDNNRPEIAVNALQGYDAGQLKTIMESAARADGSLGQEAIKGLAESRGLDPRDASVYDGGTLLMLAVARTDSPAADKLAVEFAKMAHDAPSVFEGPGGKDRIDALTLTVSSHSKAVFDVLTNFDTTNIQGKSDTNNLQFKENATDLGALFQLTLFNPDSTYSATLQGKIVDYATGLTTAINQPGSNTEEIGRLAMLQASLSDAITQGYDKLNADEAKKKELIGFVVDLALSALPVGKWTSASVEKVIVDTFANNPKLQDALKGLSGKLIDATTGKLTDEAKKTIVDTLGKQEGSLEIAKNSVNHLNQMFAGQITDAADQTDLKTNYVTIYEAITK